MLKEKGTRYIIKKDKLVDVLRAILSIAKENVEEIVFEGLMHRAIFKLNLSSSHEGETAWLRVRSGDVDCDGQTNCTVTFKKKNHSIDDTQMTELAVSDYYTAIDFFMEIGHVLTSVQETLRTKYVFHYEGVKYIICFDEWPHIKDIYFVTVIPGDSASLDEFKGVCNMIGLDKLNEKYKVVDVDAVYREMFGKSASDIPNVRFNMPIEKEKDSIDN